MRYLFTVLLLFFYSLLAAQETFMQDVWLNENRTSLRANVLAMDKNGYMIIGTEQGLYRYNGNTIKLINSADQPEVTALSSQQGKVWVGYKNGNFGYIDNDSVVLKKYPAYQSTATIHAIAVREDVIWLGTEEGVFQIKQKGIKRYRTEEGLSDDFIYSLVFIDDLHFLAGTDQGINDVNLHGGKPKIGVISAKQGLQDNIARIIKSTGALTQYWIGAQQGGLSIYNTKSQRSYPVNIVGGWKWGQVNDILPLTTSRVYVTTDDGYLLELQLINPDSASVKVYSFPDKSINSLLLDKSGNIWAATHKGISMITAEFLNYIFLPPPFSLTAVTAMCCDKNNILWFALKNDLYCIDLKVDNKKMRWVRHAKEPVSVIYCDARGRLWLGTSGDGLWVKEESGVFHKVKEATQGTENILSITSVLDQIWISSLNGVRQFTFEDGRIGLLKKHDKAAGIGSDYIYQLFGDSKHNVWMATDGAGVCMFDDSGYHHWKIFDPEGSSVVYTITEDAAGNIWAGTLYKDLFRFADNRWTNLRKAEIQDIDVNLSTINANATGQVVAVYQRCIDLWYPRSNLFRHFNNRHNMGIDSTSRMLNCGARDVVGNVYIPFEKGILIFKNQSGQFDIKPEVFISKVSNNLKDVSGKQVEFGPDENYLSFYFDGISYTNPERLNYRFRLEGYSDNWIYTNESLATFPKLPAGYFTFKVQVSLNGSFEHVKEAAYSFSIAAPIWKRPWFIIIATVLLVTFVSVLIRYRDLKLKRLAQLEQEKVIFGYEHLKSQVNPHFLFNSLNTLTNLIEENQDNAVAYTERLSDLYRNMLTYHNKDLITLEEEWAILMAYLYIQQSRFGQALQINGDIPDVWKGTKKIPPMALQLLVENAIKHNVVSLSSPLVIDIIIDENEIVVSNRINPKIKQETESGIGLANISNRYAMLSRRKVYYGKDNNYWIVKLPLL